MTTANVSLTKQSRQGQHIVEAIRQGVREAVIRHKKLGESIVVWRDGKVVWVNADEISADEIPAETR